MLRPFVSGQKIRKLPTRALNEEIDFAQKFEQYGDRSSTAMRRLQFEIRIHNTTPRTVFEKYDAVGLEETLIDPIDNEWALKQQIAIDGLVPTFNHVSRFAVMQESNGPGRVGKALLYGVTAALWNAPDFSTRSYES